MMQIEELGEEFTAIETADSITLTALQKFELTQKERLINELERLRLNGR